MASSSQTHTWQVPRELCGCGFLPACCSPGEPEACGGPRPVWGRGCLPGFGSVAVALVTGRVARVLPVGGGLGTRLP